jgi:hypothetical protein
MDLRQGLGGRLQFIARLGSTISVIAVDHKDEALRVLKVVPANEPPYQSRCVQEVRGQERCSQRAKSQTRCAQQPDKDANEGAEGACPRGLLGLWAHECSLRTISRLAILP